MDNEEADGVYSVKFYLVEDPTNVLPVLFSLTNIGHGRYQPSQLLHSQPYPASLRFRHLVRLRKTLFAGDPT